MAEALQLPLDFERLAEFRLLVNALKEKVPSAQAVDERTLDAHAVFIWMRLFVELALLAKTTNRPGYLTVEGKILFESTLDPFFGDDCDPTNLLTEAKVLERRGEEWYCGRFAQLNAHFARDYIGKERRGNFISQIVRSEKHIQHEANQQAMLLGASVFKRPDGQAMSDREVQLCMFLIRRLDNCLKARSRRPAEYTEGFLQDAYDVSVRHVGKTEDLNRFYAWLLANRDHPRVPKTAEGVLKQFDELLTMALD